MKVSEAIDRLKVGDTVWVKGTFDLRLIDTEEIRLEFSDACSGLWLNGEQEISLTEPQVEKVEVPDFVANYVETEKHRDSASIDEVFSPGFVNEWDEVNKWLYDNPTEENERRYLMAIRAYVDGYTVKPKRWVVKNTDGDLCYLKRFRIGEDCIDGESSGWVGERSWAFTFDDKSKAEAVATLVEGSVEEV